MGWIYIFIIVAYLVIGWFVIFNKNDNESKKDIFKNAFKSNFAPVFRIAIGILGSLLFLVVILIVLGIWPIVYLIRLYNENKTSKNKSNQNYKNKKLKGIQSKYEGFDVEMIKPKIIERNDRRALEISKQFPSDGIFYVSDEPNLYIEGFLNKNLNKIKSRFLKKHPHNLEYKFIIPDFRLFDGYSNRQIRKKLTYNFPSLPIDNEIFNSIRSSSIKDFTDQLRKDLNIQFPLEAGLFRVINGPGSNSSSVIFSYVKLPVDSEENIDKALWFYLSNLRERRDNGIYHSLMSEKDLASMGQSHELADFRFDYHAHKLSKEIGDKIESLKLKGYEDILLRSLLKKIGGHEIKKTEETLESPLGKKLSPMVIDQNFKIYLSGYNNLEIKMPSLSKALYILFLRHPEGIRLKHLSDHKSELLKIYQAISLRESYDEAIASIEDLVNPLSNSINEKASRIKSAFVKHFSEEIARHYHITGERGEKKVVILKRSLVEWKVKDLEWPFQRSKSTKKSKKEEEIINNKYSQALNAIADKDYFLAKTLLTDIIELNNNHYDAYRLRANCHFDLLQYEEAEKDNNMAIKLNPNVCISHHNRAETRLMLGKYEEALQDITTYLKEVDNKCAESYYVRGLIYFEQGSEKAKQDFVNAKELGHKDATKMLKQCKGKIPRRPDFEKKT